MEELTSRRRNAGKLKPHPKLGVKTHTMKKTIALIFAASTLFLAGCCTTPHVTKWEYKVESTMDWKVTGTGREAWLQGWKAHLDELGKEGWELICQHETAVYLKRPVK